MVEFATIEKEDLKLLEERSSTVVMVCVYLLCAWTFVVSINENIH